MTCHPPLRPPCPHSTAAVLAAVLAAALTAAPAFAAPSRPGVPPPAPPQQAQTRPANGYVRVWKPGDHIARYDFHLLTAYRRYDLPPPPQGQAYVQLGNQVLRADLSDLRVVASVGPTIEILGAIRPGQKAPEAPQRKSTS